MTRSDSHIADGISTDFAVAYLNLLGRFDGPIFLLIYQFLMNNSDLFLSFMRSNEVVS